MIHMTSMEIVQFSDPLVPLHQKFSRARDLGRPISNEPLLST